MTRCDTAIVGGGFSGTMVAAQLSRHAPPGHAVCLFDPAELGRGAAYGTRHNAHLLNTRAQAMTAFPDEPDHFVRWLGARAGAREFVSRRMYGDYLADIARRAFERPGFWHANDAVAWLELDGDEFALQTVSGARIAARSVVLATGNPLPNDDFLPRALVQHPGYIADPWRANYSAIGGHVLLIGSGLTALDVLVALESAGHRGAVHVVSRNARFPQVHSDAVHPYDVAPALDTSSARALLRSFRAHVSQAQQRGYDWRAVVDAVRPESETLWKRLAPAERRRFDRHLRATWDRHRHRAPQQVDAARERYRSSGRMHVYAGRIGDCKGGFVTLALRGGQSANIRPDWIVNCTGVGRNERMRTDPLYARLLATDTVSLEPLGMGLRVDASLTAIDGAGRRVEGLFVAGPLTRGSRFEATAVPELRIMAQTVAVQIVRLTERDVSLTG